MELSDLLTFSTVARLGGITRAADELNTVQSNVTQRVKALEAEIGTALFERHSRGMTLTGAGRRLLPYAQRMAALSREALLAARDDGEPKGPLAIGSMETTAAVRLPCPARRIPSPLPAGAIELADLDDRRAGGGRAQRYVRRRVRRGSNRACRTRCDGRLPGRAGAGDRAAMDEPRRPACGHAGVRADRAGVPDRLHLPPAARADLLGVRLAVFRAVRTRHARRHDRLRRRRHGRDAIAARRGRAERHA